MKVLLMIVVAVGVAISVNAQNVPESKYGVDSVACVSNISSYSKAYKQWESSNFAPELINTEMIKDWREVFSNCPYSTQDIYFDGMKIMDYFIKTCPENKDAYIDTICILYDSLAKFFPISPKTGKSRIAGILANKGVWIFAYNQDRYEEAYDALKEAVALDSTLLQDDIIKGVFKFTADKVNEKKNEELAVVYTVDKLRNKGKGAVYIGNVKSPKQVAAYGTPAWVFTTMSISFIDNICLLVFNNCVYSINMYTGGLGNAMTSSTSEATQVNYLVNNGNVYVWDPTKGTPKNDSDYLFVFRIEDEHLKLIKAKESSYELGKYVYMSDYNKMKKMSEEELVQIEKEALGKLLGN